MRVRVWRITCDKCGDMIESKPFEGWGPFKPFVQEQKWALDVEAERDIPLLTVKRRFISSPGDLGLSVDWCPDCAGNVSGEEAS